MKTLMNFALILATLASVAVGQGKADVDRIGEKIASQLESKLSGWRYKRVEPFAPSSNIVVQSWASTNRCVQVTFAIRESVEDAKKEIRSFLEFRREPQELIGFDDEAFAPERDGIDMVMRRGRYVIYISIVTYVENDLVEVQRIKREFAKQLSSIELPQ